MNRKRIALPKLLFAIVLPIAACDTPPAASGPKAEPTQPQTKAPGGQMAPPAPRPNLVK